MKLEIIKFILILSLAAPASAFAATKDTINNTANLEKKTINLVERTEYLLTECSAFLKKSNWFVWIDGDRVNAFRLENQYDDMSIEINTDFDKDLYVFKVAINKNEKLTSRIFRLKADIVNDDDRLRDIILSDLLPSAVLRDGTGNFRKAYSSVFSIGYARTSDGREFYPVYTKGNLHFSWSLEYDPSSKILQNEMPLGVGDYMSFNVYFDWANKVHENFFNIDLMLFGKNKYKGTPEHGTRFMYGFFNGLEYFRPGFSNSTVQWDQDIYHTKPYIQYLIWRALQWNMMISRTDGSSIYSAGLMLGAGVGIGPSSLFYSGLSEEEEEDMSPAFRSIRYRKQNYYFSYTLPSCITLSADHVYGFRFEFGYNYYFFFPIITDNLYDMLHILKGSIGYYLTSDVMLSAQYERWMIESMVHDRYKRHNWNRLIIEFRNFY